MKKIIDGKRYDTEKAELIFEWDNGVFPNDFRFREKNLYRTQNGNWFLVHQGGALTDMQVPSGSNSCSGSSDIEPISENDAFRFLATHGGTEEAEKYFADKIQDA